MGFPDSREGGGQPSCQKYNAGKSHSTELWPRSRSLVWLLNSILAPVLGYLRNGHWKKFSKYALRLVQSPHFVHGFTPGQCKMCFAANVVLELPTHFAGWELYASRYLLDEDAANGGIFCSLSVYLEELMQVLPTHGRSQVIFLFTYFWLSLTRRSSDMFWYTPNTPDSCRTLSMTVMWTSSHQRNVKRTVLPSLLRFRCCTDFYTNFVWVLMKNLA